MAPVGLWIKIEQRRCGEHRGIHGFPGSLWFFGAKRNDSLRSKDAARTSLPKEA
jgi:hypothetical protein